MKKSEPPVARTVAMIHTKDDEKGTWTSKRKLREEQHSKEKKTTQRLTEKTAPAIPLRKEKYVVKEKRKESERFSVKKREKEGVAGKEAAAVDYAPDSTHRDPEDEEWDSDDRSEDEEDRDSEQAYSNEEEGTEADDESFAATSEDEVQGKNGKSLKRTIIAERKERQESTAGKGKEEKRGWVSPAGSLGENESLDPGCYSKDQEKKSKIIELSDPGKDQEEREIQSKKRSRKKHRESSMSPMPRGSSSPSTSQEENKKKHAPRGQSRESDCGKKKREKEKESVPSSSGTDDSSPECDIVRSLSESETKNLRKLFRCFFGKLCCGIRDPVETAAQLQAKRLLSRSTMENMITSPESQQVKAIALVRALGKKLKSHPDRIFTVIGVLIHNEGLRETGTEMCREAGNTLFVCLCPKFIH